MRSPSQTRWRIYKHGCSVKTQSQIPNTEQGAKMLPGFPQIATFSGDPGAKGDASLDLWKYMKYNVYLKINYIAGKQLHRQYANHFEVKLAVLV